LYAEADPEKDIKLDKALEYLVDSKHLLDLPISSQELVNLPAKLVVDCPSKSNVSKLCDGDDDWKDCRKNVNGKVREATLGGDVGQRVPNFERLYDCINEEQGVEDPRRGGRGLGNELLSR
jgi:hypothetical protein